MKRQVYLDAMEISRWRIRGGSERLVVLTDNVHQAINHPLVVKVLKLIGYKITECEFVSSAVCGDHILWDMRLMNRPHKPGIIYSPPLDKLLNSGESKRSLWQQIWQQQQQER